MSLITVTIGHETFSSEGGEFALQAACLHLQTLKFKCRCGPPGTPFVQFWWSQASLNDFGDCCCCSISRPYKNRYGTGKTMWDAFANAVERGGYGGVEVEKLKGEKKQ